MAVSSLYEGLEVETKRPSMSGGDSADIGWFHDDTSRMKFMTSQLQRTKILKDRLYSQQNAKSDQLYPDDIKPPRDVTVPPVNSPNRSPMITKIHPITDAYNPMRPNDYEDFARDRAIHREIERLERMKKEEDEFRRKQLEDKRKRKHRRRSHSSSDSEGEHRRGLKIKVGDGAAIPPPPNLSDKISVDRPESGSIDQISDGIGKIAQVPKGLSVAANIMSKYGWKEGMGLGRESQGISTALVVEKTSRRGGKILKNSLCAEAMAQQENSAQALEELKHPTKVLLLQNMVGRGQVDPELNEEVTEECRKYGEVVKTVIFEIPEGVPEQESVRIYIEFTRNESAIKAFVDLNGRYFAGRIVKGSFFDEERFAKSDLGPIPV
ncbi:Splicing factor 45-like [Oopsacas minuta]|uniref:Splicing factor 45 n=1 Tax=Oopsacas minuta TaxID=111878 RepID=A0AAV7KN41_9METZ|nr:Splicing factor 45-like [Oopsacas minuta]